jgi:hypothetical protein
VLSVTAIDAEAERRPSLATLKPGRDDVARHDRSIHCFRELSLVEIARNGPDARKVRLAGGESHEIGKVPLSDHIGCRGPDDQIVVVLSEPPAQGVADKPINGTRSASFIQRKISR